MNFVLQSSDQTLLSISAEELRGVTNALNEVCNGIHIPEASFQTRLGVSREFLSSLLGALLAEPHPTRRGSDLANAWAEHGAVMVRAISVFGDPIEMGETQSAAFSEQLRQAIAEAS